MALWAGPASAALSFDAAADFPSSPPAVDSWTGMVVDDFNEDFKDDVAVVDGTTSGTVSDLLGDGHGGFPDPFSTADTGGTPSANDPHGLVTADFDRDGCLDLATADTGTDNVDALHGDQPSPGTCAGTFATGTQSTVTKAGSEGDGPRWLIQGDLDEDGLADVATVNQADDTIS